MTERVQVTLKSECTEHDRSAVAGVFESARIPVAVEGAYIRRSAEQLPWLIDIEAGVKFLAMAAGTGFGLAAGTAAWKALKTLVNNLYEARGASETLQGAITLTDPDTSIEIQLPPNLPDLAYISLLEIDELRAPDSGVLKWDNELHVWTDPLAGKLPCRYPGCTEPATQGRVRQMSPTTMERREFCGVHAATADIGDPQAWA